MRPVLLPLLIALALAGCSPEERLALEGAAFDVPAAPLRPGPTCRTVASHATTVGEDFTRSLADEAILYRIDESRGALLQQGLHPVRVADRRTTCNEHLWLGPGCRSTTAWPRRGCAGGEGRSAPGTRGEESPREPEAS